MRFAILAFAALIASISASSNSGSLRTDKVNDRRAMRVRQHNKKHEQGDKHHHRRSGNSKMSSKAPSATAAPVATVSAKPGPQSLSSAISIQLAGQLSGFLAASKSLDAKITKATQANFHGKGSNKVSQSSLTLDGSQINTGSTQPGSPAAGQAKSATSGNNFINFCATKKVPLLNGLQQRQLACNPIPMGMVVPIQQTPSARFKFPANGQTVPANKDINMQLNINNLQTGVFTDATSTYYSAPADANAQGLIIGHSHFSCQAINGLGDTKPPNPAKFVFFKGIDTTAVNGVLSFTIVNGFPAGTYRCCTINSSSNHQPVLSTIAQRGSIDDCVSWTAK